MHRSKRGRESHERAAQLEANIEQRQEIIKELCTMETMQPKECAAVACVCLMIDKQGEVRSRAVNVEPEHIPAILEQQESIGQRFRAFLWEKAKEPKAKVLRLVSKMIASIVGGLAWAVADASLLPAWAYFVP